MQTGAIAFLRFISLMALVGGFEHVFKSFRFGMVAQKWTLTKPEAL